MFVTGLFFGVPNFVPKMFIKQRLNTLKTQLDNNKLKVISHQGEIQTVGFHFNQPLNDDSILKVKLNKNWHLPDDYEFYYLCTMVQNLNYILRTPILA